ncbi:MAG: rhodanese-related sulfurtransferase [bacterium]|nr:rhodanese-related sulfurtransferase [bacterium]
MTHQILLYYKYINIEDPEALMAWQKKLCEELTLKGRIIIAKEGINGTVEGTRENTERYIEAMKADPLFADVHWKISASDGLAFPKLSIKVRSEIVSAHLDGEDVNPTEVTGRHLNPEELHELLKSGEEVYVVDMRNDYEHRVGHFKNSILPPLTNFRDLPKIIPELEYLKDKKVVTVCTGGVRCEKASGYLIKKGFKDVSQLNGGIVSYMEKFPNQYFKGKLYVFDGRVTMGFDTDSPAHEIIGQCDKCNKQSENYINCNNNLCHRHFICCVNCIETSGAFCGDQCRN